MGTIQEIFGLLKKKQVDYSNLDNMTEFNITKITKKYRNMYDDACLVSLAYFWILCFFLVNCQGRWNQ